MIGNDLVSLQLAALESNWQRKGYLDKIYTPVEQQLILQSVNPSLTLWILWSIKEAAYKIVNRLTGIRSYSPLSYVCAGLQISGLQASGEVQYQDQSFFTSTEIKQQYVHSVAACKPADFDHIFLHYLKNTADYIQEFNTLSSFYQLGKNSRGLPEMTHLTTGNKHAASISHHGAFLAVIYSDSLLSAD